MIPVDGHLVIAAAVAVFLGSLPASAEPSPVPNPLAMGAGAYRTETSAGIIAPGPGCEDGAVVVAGGGGSSPALIARPLTKSLPAAVIPASPSLASVNPESADNQLVRLGNGDLLLLWNSTTSGPLPTGKSKPSWWNIWFSDSAQKPADPATHPVPRNGYRQVQMLRRTSCGLQAAQWLAPLLIDSALVGALDQNDTLQQGYCGKSGPWVEGWDRPEIAVDPWGIQPQDPSKQRLYFSSKCDRDDDSSSQVWVSNDSGETWSDSRIRLPRSGQTAMTTVRSGRLYMVQCEGTDVKVYWSDDHGASKAGGVKVNDDSLPCAGLAQWQLGLDPPPVHPVSVARIDDNGAILIAYPSVKPGAAPSQVYPVVRIDPDALGVKVSQLLVVSPLAAGGAILQAHFIEDDRAVAEDRSALLTWFETNGVTIQPGTFVPTVKTKLRYRAGLFRTFKGGVPAPFVPSTLDTSGGWDTDWSVWYGDYTKGGSAVLDDGTLVFLTSWPQGNDNFYSTWAVPPFSRKDRYNAVWEKGPARPFAWRLSLDELAGRIQRLSAAGYSLRDLNTVVLGPSGLAAAASPAGVSAPLTQVGYNAIWEKTSAPRPWIAGWTFQDFVKKNDEMQKAGFQVLSVNAFMLPEGARYNAVWDKLPDFRPAIFGWNQIDYRKQALEMEKQGFRPLRLNAVQLSGGPRYNAIWIKDSQKSKAVAGVSLSSLQAQDAALAPQGYRIIDLNTYVTSQGELYNAVWQQKLIAVPWIAGWGDIAAKHTELKAQGFALSVLSGMQLN